MVGDHQTALRRGVCRFTLGIVILGAAASVRWSELLAQPVGNDRAQSLFANMVAERERLHAGDVRVRGHVVYRQIQAGVASSSDQMINEEIVFDYTHNWIRHKIEMNPQLGNETDRSSQSSHLVNTLGPDASYQLQVEAKAISISEKQQVKALDLRAIGLFSFVDLQSPPSLIECISRIDGQKISVSKDETTSVDILTIDYVDKSDGAVGIRPIMRRRIWIDVEHGHTPVRMEDQMWNAQAGSWSPNHTSATVDWRRIDDVWVPVSAVLEINKGNAPMQLRRNTYEVAIEWKQVNKTPDPIEFTLAGLDVPPGSHLIVDSRIVPGKATIVQEP